jgi:hypothetical protein
MRSTLLHVTLAIHALPGAALDRLELRELGLPEAQDISREPAKARNLADTKVELVRNHRIGGGALLAPCLLVSHSTLVASFEFQVSSKGPIQFTRLKPCSTKRQPEQPNPDSSRSPSNQETNRWALVVRSKQLPAMALVSGSLRGAIHRFLWPELRGLVTVYGRGGNPICATSFWKDGWLWRETRASSARNDKRKESCFW